MEADSMSQSPRHLFNCTLSVSPNPPCLMRFDIDIPQNVRVKRYEERFILGNEHTHKG